MWPFKKKSPPPADGDDRLAAFAPLVLASDRVTGPQRLPVRYAYRSEPNNPHDSGWIFQSGDETQAWLDANPPKIYPLERFIRMDESLLDIVRAEVGSAWERDSAQAPWRRIEDFRRPD
ncbi:DUF2185 domain-containing protein [Lysobacter sp. CCNWLW3]|uniref:immunity protein Imm33 domain-containing protein n=1 Tax=unclassified Lysobacter TaxID=2635362 RepID=UPI002FD208A2